MGKYIQPKKCLTNCQNVYLTFDLIFADITPFPIGWGGRGIEN